MTEYKIGDTITLEAPVGSIFYPGIKCIITELNKEGEITKLEALSSDPRLAQNGFFFEEGKYVAFNGIFSPN